MRGFDSPGTGFSPLVLHNGPLLSGDGNGLCMHEHEDRCLKAKMIALAVIIASENEAS